ncbi:hypothetical protein [Candidatus Cloacimonas acidaminovorans]|uniref:hypothetical protein n=1 Tax=Candidatus Cloacimonas acidaminovorans TaxID=456827 RepID=UPI0012FF1F74|nr:hypothetical protein [Candidatus Cloacimonas acidaminovorans]
MKQSLDIVKKYATPSIQFRNNDALIVHLTNENINLPDLKTRKSEIKKNKNWGFYPPRGLRHHRYHCVTGFYVISTL